MIKGWTVDYLDTLDGRSALIQAGVWRDLDKIFLGLKEASWRRISDADHILTVGTASFDTQPLIGGLIRRSIIERKIPVVSVGTNDPVSPGSFIHIPAGEGWEDRIMAAFLSSMLKMHSPRATPGWDAVLSEMKTLNIESCLNQAGLDIHMKQAFESAVGLFAGSKNPMIIAGHSVTKSLRHVMLLSLTKGILPENALRLSILKENGNSAGALRLGVHGGSIDEDRRCGVMMTDDETSSDSQFSGKIGNPDFLAVITPYFPEALKDKAHVIIPRPAMLEEEGTYTSLDGQNVRTLYPVLKKPRDVGESWQTLLALMQRTEHHPGYARWKDIREIVIGEMKPVQ
jgi:NADH dehydrogenase/NADH:ubiquinone oxidoreductase subunit G